MRRHVTSFRMRCRVQGAGIALWWLNDGGRCGCMTAVRASLVCVKGRGAVVGRTDSHVSRREVRRVIHPLMRRRGCARHARTPARRSARASPRRETVHHRTRDPCARRTASASATPRAPRTKLTMRAPLPRARRRASCAPPHPPARHHAPPRRSSARQRPGADHDHVARRADRAERRGGHFD